MGPFGKKSQAQHGYGKPPITMGSAELDDAAALIERFERSLGDNDAIWDTLEAIARRGGFVSAEHALTEISSQGIDATVALGRPWRWWATASTTALNSGDNILPARIFMFAKLFTMRMAPTMNAATQMDLGLVEPPGDTYRIIASNGVTALTQLPPDYLIHDTATGKVDVTHALAMATEDARSD